MSYKLVSFKPRALPENSDQPGRFPARDAMAAEIFVAGVLEEDIEDMQAMAEASFDAATIFFEIRAAVHTYEDQRSRMAIVDPVPEPGDADE